MRSEGTGIGVSRRGFELGRLGQLEVCASHKAQRNRQQSAEEHQKRITRISHGMDEVVCLGKWLEVMGFRVAKTQVGEAHRSEIRTEQKAHTNKRRV